MNEFQSNAARDGEHYRGMCCEALDRFGFEIVHGKGLRVEDCGVDVDIVARNRQGLVFLIECKGGYGRGKKPGGLLSSDNVRKAIGSAYCLSRSETHTGGPYTPLLVMTTYMTDHRSVNFRQLSVVESCVMCDIVSDRDADRLKMWERADYAFLQGHIGQYPTVTWVARENRFWRIPAPSVATATPRKGLRQREKVQGQLSMGGIVDC